MRRICAIAAPALMLCYGVLRWVDGLDGHRKDSVAWDLGHIAFFLAIALFGVLAVDLDLTLRRASPTRRRVADLATAATLVGAACFLWVILGDLVEAFQQAAPLPDALNAAGPAVFQVGLLTLLILAVTERPRRLPVWSPVLVLLGFTAVAVSLDALPPASILVGAGLLPLAARPVSRR